MRGFLLGLIVLPALALAVLSIRPGGFRRQLRLVKRRFKIAMVLAGVYLAVSTAVRIAWPESALADGSLVALAAIEAVVFVVVAQDPDRAPGGR